MKILVTTAGKVGSDTIAALLAAGYEVTVGARKPAALAGRFPGATVTAFDYDMPAGHAAALAGVEAVFSVAPYWLLPEGELSLFEACKAVGVKRVVKLSALGVEAFDGSPHLIAEKALEASGLSWAVIRPNFFMQNYSTMMADAVRSGTLYEPAAAGKTSFVDTRDIAAVAVKLLSDAALGGRAYGLTGPAALDRQQVADAIGTAIGREIAYVPVDDAALRQSMQGAPAPLIELMSMLYGAVRAGHTAVVTTDVATVLGRPPIAFAQFAADHAADWRR